MLQGLGFKGLNSCGVVNEVFGIGSVLAGTMQSDEMVWEEINHFHCSYKAK